MNPILTKYTYSYTHTIFYTWNYTINIYRRNLTVDLIITMHNRMDFKEKIYSQYNLYKSVD